MLKTTSSAVNGSPLWNLTPSLSVSIHMVSLFCSHFVASEGTRVNFPALSKTFLTSGSNTLIVMLFDHIEFVAWGSTEVASPVVPIITVSALVGAAIAEAPQKTNIATVRTRIIILFITAVSSFHSSTLTYCAVHIFRHGDKIKNGQSCDISYSF